MPLDVDVVPGGLVQPEGHRRLRPVGAPLNVARVPVHADVVRLLFVLLQRVGPLADVSTPRLVARVGLHADAVHAAEVPAQRCLARRDERAVGLLAWVTARVDGHPPLRRRRRYDRVHAVQLRADELVVRGLADGRRLGRRFGREHLAGLRVGVSVCVRERHLFLAYLRPTSGKTRERGPPRPAGRPSRLGRPAGRARRLAR